MTIDLESTRCETYGLAKQGARHHGYTGKRGYHPLLAIAAGTGDVLLVQTHGSTKMAEEMTDRVEAMIEEAEEELRSLVKAEVYKAQMDLIKSVGQLLDKKDNQLDATVTAAIRRVERRLMSQVRKLEKE